MLYVCLKEKKRKKKERSENRKIMETIIEGERGI